MRWSDFLFHRSLFRFFCLPAASFVYSISFLTLRAVPGVANPCRAELSAWVMCIERRLKKPTHSLALVTRPIEITDPWLVKYIFRWRAETCTNRARAHHHQKVKTCWGRGREKSIITYYIYRWVRNRDFVVRKSIYNCGTQIYRFLESHEYEFVLFAGRAR